MFRWRERFLEATIQLAEWMSHGQLRPKETVVTEGGFEAAPRALIAALRGNNAGKTVIKV